MLGIEIWAFFFDLNISTCKKWQGADLVLQRGCKLGENFLSRWREPKSRYCGIKTKRQHNKDGYVSQGQCVPWQHQSRSSLLSFFLVHEGEYSNFKFKLNQSANILDSTRMIYENLECFTIFAFPLDNASIWNYPFPRADVSFQVHQDHHPLPHFLTIHITML